VATLAQHRAGEFLGGIVYLLTIDMSHITNNPLHIRRYTNSYGVDGSGYLFQGIRYKPYPYELKQIKRSSKPNKSGSKLLIGDNEDFAFSRFIDQVGGDIQGARVLELKVYGDFLDTGVTPNTLAYSKRMDHIIDYVEDSDKTYGEKILHTQDPLSRDIQVPKLSFSSGIPNSTVSLINVFPATDRIITKDR
jgi:phage-related protein